LCTKLVFWKVCLSLVTNTFPNISLPMLQEMNRSVFWLSSQNYFDKRFLFHSLKGCFYHVFCFFFQQFIGLTSHQHSIRWLTDCINVLKTIKVFKVNKRPNFSTVYWNRYALINLIYSSPSTICTCKTFSHFPEIL